MVTYLMCQADDLRNPNKLSEHHEKLYHAQVLQKW